MRGPPDPLGASCSGATARSLAAAPKPPYTAENEGRAKAELVALDAKYSTMYPSVSRALRNHGRFHLTPPR